MRPTILLFILLFAASSFAKQVPIDLTKSKLEWIGQKVIPGNDHQGSVKISKGSINFDNKKQIIGGTLIVDMTTINNSDLTGKFKKKLEEHLLSADFFDVKKNPEASFKITTAKKTAPNRYELTGNLSIRGKTHPEILNIEIKKEGRTMLATGSLDIDRTKYGITYNSETSVLKKAIKIAKDKVIKDKFTLNFEIKTQKI